MYGVGKQGRYEPATPGLPQESIWSTEAHLDFTPNLFEAIRAKYGMEPHLLHDVHHRLTPIEAARLGMSLEPYRCSGWRTRRRRKPGGVPPHPSTHGHTPRGRARVFNTIWDCKDLIQEQLIDFVRASVVHAGGITHLRRIADLAALYQIRTGCHGATDLSPVCMGAALHFDLWVANFGIQEHMAHSDETNAVFPHAYRFEDGYLHPGDAAGHGVDVDETLAKKFPYIPAARLADGTVWKW